MLYIDLSPEDMLPPISPILDSAKPKSMILAAVFL
ncbi:unnamed protein product, partial [Adineta steineri]